MTSIEPTFDEFVATHDFFAIRSRSHWVRADGLCIYVRDGRRPWQGDFVLANIEGTGKWGSGALTRFLDKYEPEIQFGVENVLNPRLVSYLLRRGYTVVDVPGLSPGSPPHMLDTERRLTL